MNGVLWWRYDEAMTAILIHEFEKHMKSTISVHNWNVVIAFELTKTSVFEHL